MSVSIAFSPWIRAMLRIAFKVPYGILDERTQLQSRWREGRLNHVKLEQKTEKWLQIRKIRRNNGRQPGQGQGQKTAGGKGKGSGTDKVTAATATATAASLRRNKVLVSDDTGCSPDPRPDLAQALLRSRVADLQQTRRTRGFLQEV